MVILYIRNISIFIILFNIYVQFIYQKTLEFVKNLKSIERSLIILDDKFINLYCVNQNKFEIVYIYFRIVDGKFFVIKKSIYLIIKYK